MKFQWSLRQIFLWVFIAALISPHIAVLIPSRKDPLIGLSVSQTDIQSWLREIDPSVEVFGGGGSFKGNDSVESDYDYSVTMSNATDEELFDHLRKRVREKVDGGLWSNTISATGNDSFSVVLRKGFSRYRLYVWSVPTSTSDRDFAKATGKRSMGIKVLKIGYTCNR